jgi:hypothetical protein
MWTIASTLAALIKETPALSCIAKHADFLFLFFWRMGVFLLESVSLNLAKKHSWAWSE